MWDCWYTDDSAKERKCYACRMGYTVAADEVSCTSYVADENCRVVNAVNGCNMCWQGYYFDTFKCKLGGGVGGVAGVVLVGVLALGVALW